MGPIGPIGGIGGGYPPPGGVYGAIMGRLRALWGLYEHLGGVYRGFDSSEPNLVYCRPKFGQLDRVY